THGTDRYFTNERGSWYSYEVTGDRWDAWKIGYNEVFSPYSSPNTKTWLNGESDLFIYLSGMTGNDANINIYRLGYGGYNNIWQILEVTPPSKPMGLKTNYYFVNSNICHPRITWNHNSEPDMIRDDGTIRYKVYRALENDMNQVPHNYYLRAIINVNPIIPPEYIDYQIIGIESILEGEGYDPFPLRYKVVAVDKFEDGSVSSDFTPAAGLKPEGSSIDPGNGDNITLTEESPSEYNLSQNYPNPFNPVTSISFAIPKQGFVSLKIYDIAGREVKTLVNEFKHAGYYSVDFNGSSLASGVYFYGIQCGDFVSVKKMVLIK
ncbi:MAG: T9SS type A sorting domain-containing protein, partial [Ignavibacteria bacterium]|nr:T9SS type A sorting domain-containing protein [Ignavibacteria bacterium]